MATAGAEKPAGAAPVLEQEQEEKEKEALFAAAADPVLEQEDKKKEAVFAAKHAELVSEARDVAREHGVAVTTVAFRPDGTAVADEAVGVGIGGGVGLQEQVRAMIHRAIARKVALMESGELAVHRRELQMLRGIVVGALTEPNTVMPKRKEKEKDGGEVIVVAKKTMALGQQQEMDGDANAGGNKIVVGKVDD